jgi:ATP-dependent RNA helicase DDX46/PRP5
MSSSSALLQPPLLPPAIIGTDDEESENYMTGFGEDDDDDLDEMFLNDTGGGKPKVNKFGSNCITMDMIMKMGGRNKSDSYLNSGWESDVHSDVNSPIPDDRDETEEERDAREEKERKEFMEAFKKQSSQVDHTVEMKIEDIKKDNIIKKSQVLGRIFESEGDIVDEIVVIEKKKTALEILEDQKRGKELKQVDHESIEYLPFRKNLYIVPKALSKLSEEECKERREDLQIKVRGKGCPSLVENWDQCGLSERILQVLRKNNLVNPFSIQKQAIPAIMCGRDVIGVAKTGSGKTLAFLLPMLRHIQDQPPLRDNEGPIGLIMAPARELAFQINNEAKKFSKLLGIRVACIYGGAGVADQIADLKRGAEIVVCTPGRMIDILCMQAGKLVTLKRVTMVVMDEADRMFDMGFEPQIKMIIQNIRPDRQTVLFSATFPKQIEALAKKVLKFPIEIIVGERSSVNKDIHQIVEVHEEADKFLRLLQLLGIWYEKGSTLIFTDKQEKCDQLYKELTSSGYPCLSLHGGKDQMDRDHTLHEFKSGIKTIMIATSVAGRGLDVPDIVLVINYNCPNHLEDYVHRVGRTGRAGRKGTAYTFLKPDEDQYSPIMIRALERAGEKPPVELIEMNEKFKVKVDRGEAHYSNSGFVGKGYTFDPSEMNESQKMASMQRKAYDLEQGLVGDDEDEDEDGESKKESITDAITQAEQDSKDKTPLEKAKIIANAICTSKGLPTVILAKDNKINEKDTNAALRKAALVAQKMEALAKTGGSGGLSSSGNHFNDELDINDYPPDARRKVTQKNSFDEIIDRTGVAIISRGSYCLPGKKIADGEKRLHLIIEGPSELAVAQARIEILRLLDEETIRLGSSATVSTGRYSVL